MDGFQDDASGSEVEPAAAVFLGNEDRQITRIHERLNEFGRITSVIVLPIPILAGKVRAQSFDRFADLFVALIVIYEHLSDAPMQQLPR
jgi:hypothetical protein